MAGKWLNQLYVVAFVTSMAACTTASSASADGGYRWERLKFPYSVKASNSFSFSFGTADEVEYLVAMESAVDDFDDNTELVMAFGPYDPSSDTKLEIRDVCAEWLGWAGFFEAFARDEGTGPYYSCIYQSNIVDCGGQDKVEWIKVSINCDSPGFASRGYSFKRRVITHEIGHGASLAHVNCSTSSVMIHGECWSGQRELRTYDIDLINDLY